MNDICCRSVNILGKEKEMGKYDIEKGKDYTYSWYTEVDVLEFSDVTLYISGDDNGPSSKCLILAEEIISNIDKHVNRAYEYLDGFLKDNLFEDAILVEIEVGEITFFNGNKVEGFNLNFIYGDYPMAFQYRVKFKKDGWIVGYEGGPL